MYKGHCVIKKHLGSFIRAWDVHREDNSNCGEGLFYLNCLMFCPRQMTPGQMFTFREHKKMHRNDWSVGSWVAKLV